MTSKTVHFSIDPDWATDFVRTRWGEGEFQWCYEFLLGCGVNDMKIARQIIWGEKRFAPTDNPDIFTLADDDWKANPNEHHLCQYPNPFVFAEVKVAQEKLYLDREEKGFWRLYSQFADVIEQGERRGKVYPVVRDHDGDIVDRFLSDQILNDEINLSSYKPQPSMVYENGIITPDGNFYRCGVMGHDSLAVSLGYSDELEYSEEGLTPSGKALDKGCVIVSLTINDKKVRRREVTEAQRETLKKWYDLVSYSKAPFWQVEY